MLKIFKKYYTLRMYDKQKIRYGYAAIASYTDKRVLLDVQPEQSSLNNLSEGDREVKTLVSYGDFPVQTADVRQGYKADRLFYDGEWYECTSCNFWEHTPLRHWRCTYNRVSEADMYDHAPTEGGDDDDC